MVEDARRALTAEPPSCPGRAELLATARARKPSAAGKRAFAIDSQGRASAFESARLWTSVSQRQRLRPAPRRLLFPMVGGSE